MGIRFHCPTCGHKLNVKSFLAGKRGVCPQCGRGLDIPLEDQRDNGSAGRAGGDPPNPVSGVRSLVSAGNSPLSSPVSPLQPASTSGFSPRLGAPPGRAAQSSTPRDGTREPARAAPTVPVAVPSVPTAAPLASRPVATVQPALPEIPAALPVAAPLQSAAVDLIDEAPEAVWYVRPPSGGQYGPARGEVLRKWISEGRVSADSMVWREGWDDWRAGGEAFPYLRSAITPPLPVPVAYAPSTPLASSNRSYPSRRSSNSATLAITTVVVLGLMSIVLLITLVLVIT